MPPRRDPTDNRVRVVRRRSRFGKGPNAAGGSSTGLGNIIYAGTPSSRSTDIVYAGTPSSRSTDIVYGGTPSSRPA